MATQADVRRIAPALPDTEESKGRFGFGIVVKGEVKGFAWVWNERVVPKKPRISNPKVLAVRVRNLGEKDLMRAADPEKFFTEPHYNGYPTVLVRLPKIRVAERRPLLAETLRCRARVSQAAVNGARLVIGFRLEHTTNGLCHGFHRWPRIEQTIKKAVQSAHSVKSVESSYRLSHGLRG